MANSTIGSFVILGPQGPSGPIGPTGETGNTGNTGPTGPTGDYGRYITTILPSPDKIIFTLSDGTTKEVFGNFRGATSEFFISGITSSFELNDNEILHDYGSIISSYDDSTKTLYVKGLSASGSLYLTEDNDYIYIHTNLSEQNSQKDIATLQSRTLIYLKENFKISSTSVGVSYDDGIYYNGTLVYDDVGSGNGRAKLNASAKINYIGPIFKNENPIYLNADEAGVFYLSTPIGIAGITGTFRKNESISLTIIPESENIWHFPSNIYFEEAENYLTCGKSVINLISTDQGETWLATVAARGFDVSTGTCTISNTLGSCCYQGVDFSIKCLDYTSKEICDSLAGTFSPLKSCDTACGTVGICCSNGKCIENSNPSECEAFGGRFFLGLTCGAYNNDPNSTNFGNRLCPNNCEQDGLVSCCKDGVCLGEDYTKLLCEHLGGNAFDKTCIDAKCCEQNIGIGPCCTSTGCRELTKAECDAVVGIYMGEGFACEEINCECFNINEEVGACCDSGNCSQKYRSECTGKWIGGPCQLNSCDTETIACCYCDDGITKCLDTTPVICTNLNGTNQGNSCSIVNCSIQNCGTNECDTTIDPDPCDNSLNDPIVGQTFVKFNNPYNKADYTLNENGSGGNHSATPPTFVDSNILSPGISNLGLVKINSGNINSGNISKYVLRSPIAVKDFYVPIEGYHTANGKSIKIDQSTDTARFCMAIKADPRKLKSFRIYLLRTGFPKFFSHNYAALLGLTYDNVKYQFLDNSVVNSNLKENRVPAYNIDAQGVDQNFQNGDILYDNISLDNESIYKKVFLPGTYKLRRTLNNPLYGLIRYDNDQDFDLTNQGGIPNSTANNDAYDNWLTKQGVHMMGTNYQPSFGYTFAAFISSTNQSATVHSQYNSSVSSFTTTQFNAFNFTNDTAYLSLNPLMHKNLFKIFSQDYEAVGTGGLLGNHTDPTQQSAILRTSLKLQKENELKNIINNNPTFITNTSSINAIGYYSYNTKFSSVADAYKGILCGYYTPGYKKITLETSNGGQNTSPINGSTGTYQYFLYKQLSKLSSNYANSFFFAGSTNEASFFGYTASDNSGNDVILIENEIVNTGHPWTVDLENPGYQITNDGFGANPPKKLVANIKKTYPEAIIYDSGAIEIQTTPIFVEGITFYHRYLDDVILPNRYNPTTDSINAKSRTTKIKNYSSRALSDPYDGRPNSTKQATYPYAKTTAASNLDSGKVVFNACITIPNASKYIKTIDPADNPSNPANGDGDNDDFIGRLLYTNDTLRLVIFTDISDHTIDNSMSTNTIPDLSITFNQINGECVLQPINSDCTYCEPVPPSTSCTTGNEIIFKYKSTSKGAVNCGNCGSGIEGDRGLGTIGGAGNGGQDPCCDCCPASSDTKCAVGRCEFNKEFLIEGKISKFDDNNCNKLRFSYGIYVQGGGVVRTTSGTCGGLAQARPQGTEANLFPNFPDTKVYDIQRVCEYDNQSGFVINRVFKKNYPVSLTQSPPYDYPALYIDDICEYNKTINVFNNTWPPSWRYLSDYIEGCIISEAGSADDIQYYKQPENLIKIINKLIEVYKLEVDDITNYGGKFYDSLEQNTIENTPFLCDSNFAGTSSVVYKKLYIDNINYICIPMNSQVENVNNYEDCDGGAT